MYSAPPEGMRVKKKTRKEIEFDNEFVKLDDLPYVESGTYKSVVRLVNEHTETYSGIDTKRKPTFLYPQFQRFMPDYPEHMYCWAFTVSYELTDLCDGNSKYFYAEHICVDPSKPPCAETERFFGYLEENGIFSVDDFIGCREEITFGIGVVNHIVNTIGYTPQKGPMSRKKIERQRALCICNRKFIYEPVN